MEKPAPHAQLVGALEGAQPYLRYGWAPSMAGFLNGEEWGGMAGFLNLEVWLDWRGVAGFLNWEERQPA